MSGMKWTIVVVFMTCMAVGHCQSCEKAEDCKEGQCCVANSLSQIRGKGYCRRLVALGRPCNLEEKTLESYGNKYIARCPCASGLTCEPSARYRNGRNPLLAEISQRCRKSSTSTTSDTRVTTPSTNPGGRVTPSITTPGEVITVPGEVGEVSISTTSGRVTDGDGNEITSTEISSTVTEDFQIG